MYSRYPIDSRKYKTCYCGVLYKEETDGCLNCFISRDIYNSKLKEIQKILEDGICMNTHGCIEKIILNYAGLILPVEEICFRTEFIPTTGTWIFYKPWRPK